MRHRKGVIAAVMMAFLLTTAAQCNPAQSGKYSTVQSFSNSGLTKLAFQGDSITFQSTADINAHYGANYDVAIHATVGVDTSMRGDAVAADAAQDPAIEIINLGTNDAVRIGTATPPTIDDVTGRLELFATEFPASTCIIFVNINTHNPDWGPANAQAIDDFFSQNPLIFPHVVPWDAAWQASNFIPGKNGTAANPDGPHPNETGRQLLLKLEDQAIQGCPAQAPAQLAPTT